VTTTRTSLFASTELAARVERAESEMIALCATGEADDGFVVPLGGGHASYAGPNSPFNKVSGLGFTGLPDASSIAAVEALYAERGTVAQFEVSQLAEPGLAMDLTRRGYQLVSFENVLGCRLDDSLPAVRPSPGIVVEHCDDRIDEWLAVVLPGSLAPDTVGLEQHESFPVEELERAERAGVRAGARLYLASLDGAPAGGGSIRFAGGIAQLTGAATVPEHRRRGVQSALVRTRLDDARRAGCDLAVVTCQPGSTSQANMQKLGFDLLYTRAVLLGAA